MEKDAKDPSVRYVWGKATDGSIDSDEQIVDPAFAKKALADWYETGANVRQMHATTLPPAGKGVLLESKSGSGADDGEWVRTKVVEPVAVKLVDEGVYTGYSVGIARPRIDRDRQARGGRIVGGKIVEISLVDRPALPTAKFAVLKSAGRGALQFVGKVVLLDGVDETDAPDRKQVKQLQKGMHVTAHVHAGGAVEAVEGRVVTHSRHGFTLDVRGFDREGGERAIDRSDVLAIYKGSVPAEPVNKAAGLTHTHEHSGPDGVPHTHVHTHAPNHGDHSVAHAHGHSTEESVADDTKQQPPQDATPPADDTDVDGDDGSEPDADDAQKAAAVACTNCGASDFGDDGKCSKCGTMKAADADVAKAAAKAEKAAKRAAAKAEKAAAKPAPIERDGQWYVAKGTKDVAGPFATEDEATASIAEAKTAAKAARAEKAEARKAAKIEKRKAAVAKAAAETPFAIKRLHDATCAVYDNAAVESAYPSAEGSLLGKSSRAALYEQIVAAMQDGNPDQVAGLSKAIAALNDLRKAEKRGGVEVTKAIDAAHADLNTVFKMANGLTEAAPDGLPKPGDDSVTPGKFTRGYISAGHQDETGAGHGKAKIPQNTHPVHANDFGRGPLTEGHQRYITEKVSALHDGLSEWKPDLCRMSGMDAKGSFAAERQPVGALRGDENMLPFRAVPNQATASPMPVDAGKTLKAPGEKRAKGFTASDLEGMLAKATEPLLTKIQSLEGTVEALAAAPDPSRSALRGVTGYPVAKPKIEKAAKVGRKGSRKAEKIDYMRSLATSGDPAQRIEAMDWLASRGVDPV